MSGENLGNFVRFWGRTTPNDAAVVHDQVATSWSELDTRTNRLASGLAKAGVGAGDRIGLLAPNCLEFVETVVASFKLGAITVPLNHRLTAAELRYMVRHSGCRALVVHPSFADVATKALEELSQDAEVDELIRVSWHSRFGIEMDKLYAAGTTDPSISVDSNSIAFICYTSGTTGLPKGAMLTHGNVLANAYFRALADDYTRRARLYLPAPLAFTGTLMTWAFAFVGGGVTVLDTVVDPRRSLELIERHKITHFAAVPVIWEMMLHDPEFANYDLTSLHTCVTGGATVTPQFLRSMWEAGLPVRNGYGLTEGAGYCTWQSLEASQRDPTSVGRPGIHSRVRVIDHGAKELIDMPVGDVGEIAEKGPEVMLGYWNDPHATSSAIVDGWLRTGDLGFLTQDGDLHVVGRIKDMFISGGINVYPAEVEGVLEKMDGIRECAIIGVTDEKWGETGVAIVCPMPGATIDPAGVREYCTSYLADYKLPKYVVLRDTSLPRNMSGKILKRQLQEEYSNPDALGPPLH